MIGPPGSGKSMLAKRMPDHITFVKTERLTTGASSYDNYSRRLMEPLLLPIAVLLCLTGAYAVANTICPARWNEKIRPARLIGFISIFAVAFVGLSFFMLMASFVAFGR